MIKPVLCACFWFLFIFVCTYFLFKFNGIKQCQQNIFTRDLYLHSGKIDRHFNPQFTHKTGFWDCKMGHFMQYKLQYDLHRFLGCVVCNMFVKQAWKEISESAKATIQLTLKCSGSVINAHFARGYSWKSYSLSETSQTVEARTNTFES